MSFIYVISEEQVVKGVDVSCVKWGLPDVEEPHEIDVLPMDITNNLYWRSDLLDDDWLSSQDLGALVGKLNDMLSFAWELSSWLDILTLLWLKQWLQEHLTKGVIRVLVNLGVVLLLRVELLGLLSELVDGDLTNNQGEVLSCVVLDRCILDLRGSNMSLIRELEHPVHIVQVLWILLDSLLLVFITLFAGLLMIWRLDLLEKVLVPCEELLRINLADL